jgi:AcrR family transcriptional regulator
VAKRIGIHTTLLHYYFNDKQHLFEEVFARRAGARAIRREGRR